MKSSFLAAAAIIASIHTVKAEEQAHIDMPTPAQAMQAHCGFSSDEAFGAYLGVYRGAIEDSYRKYGRVPPSDVTNPFARRFDRLYLFQDRAAYSAWRAGADAYALKAVAQRLPERFSQCQALAAAAHNKAPVIAFIPAGAEGNFAAIFDVPKL